MKTFIFILLKIRESFLKLLPLIIGGCLGLILPKEWIKNLLDDIPVFVLIIVLVLCVIGLIWLIYDSFVVGFKKWIVNNWTLAEKYYNKLKR